MSVRLPKRAPSQSTKSIDPSSSADPSSTSGLSSSSLGRKSSASHSGGFLSSDVNAVEELQSLPPLPGSGSITDPSAGRDHDEYDEFGMGGSGAGDAGSLRRGSATPTPTIGSSGLASSASSIHKSDFHSPSLTPSHSQSQSRSQTASIEHLRAVGTKRIATFVHLRQAHAGRTHWYNTVLLSHEALSSGMDPCKLSQRTTRFAVLGMSISSLLDIMTPSDFLRGLANLLQEYETIPDANFKPKMKGLFKQSGRAPRKSGTGGELSFSDVGDSSYLYSPNIPFELDYFEVLYTLCDIMIEVYHKLLFFLGGPLPSSSSTTTTNAVATPTSSSFLGVPTSPPSSEVGSPGASQVAASPSAVAATASLSSSSASTLHASAVNLPAPPTPGSASGTSIPLPPPSASASTHSFSPSLSSSTSTPPSAPNPSQTSIFSPFGNNFVLPSSMFTGTSGLSSGFGMGSGQVMGSASSSGSAGSGLSGGMVEMIYKIDARLKRMIAVITKETDLLARQAIRDELATLDPMLAGLGGFGLEGAEAVGGEE